LERRIVPNRFGAALFGDPSTEQELLAAVSALAVESSAPAQVSQSAADWHIKYSPDMPPKPTSNPDGGWFFAFPSVASPFDYTQYLPHTPPSVHYVTTDYKTPLAETNSVSMTLTVTASADAVFNYQMEASNNGPTPATVRFYFSDQNDKGGEYDRWWSNPTGYALQPGTATLTVSFSPANWSDVFGNFGTSNPAAFDHALSHVTDIGVTFGGGYFFGHGVNISSSTPNTPAGTAWANFTMNSFTVT
jgi:hypothetical protein